jgi:hypothetical protein
VNFIQIVLTLGEYQLTVISSSLSSGRGFVSFVGKKKKIGVGTIDDLGGMYICSG